MCLCLYACAENDFVLCVYRMWQDKSKILSFRDPKAKDFRRESKYSRHRDFAKALTRVDESTCNDLQINFEDGVLLNEYGVHSYSLFVI
jgi:hypothetical protein